MLGGITLVPSGVGLLLLLLLLLCCRSTGRRARRGRALEWRSHPRDFRLHSGSWLQVAAAEGRVGS